MWRNGWSINGRARFCISSLTDNLNGIVSESNYFLREQFVVIVISPDYCNDTSRYNNNNNSGNSHLAVTRPVASCNVVFLTPWACTNVTLFLVTTFHYTFLEFGDILYANRGQVIWWQCRFIILFLLCYHVIRFIIMLWHVMRLISNPILNYRHCIASFCSVWQSSQSLRLCTYLAVVKCTSHHGLQVAANCAFKVW